MVVLGPTQVCRGLGANLVAPSSALRLSLDTTAADAPAPGRQSARKAMPSLVLKVVLAALPFCAAPASATSNYNAEDYVLAAGKFIDPSDNRDDLIAIARSPTGVSGLIEATPSGLGVVHQTWTSEHLGIPWANGGVLPIVGNFNNPTDGRDDIFLQRSVPGLHYVSLLDAWFKLTTKDQTFSDSHLGATWSQQTARVITGDFDGDGRGDLFRQPRRRGELSGVAEAGADGKFVTALSPYWTSDLGGLKWAAADSLVHAGDFNGDGRSDLLVQAFPVSVPLRSATAVPGSLLPVIVPIDRYVTSSNGIAWSMTSSFSSTTSRWNRKDLGADWSPRRYVVHVGRFDGDATDDVFLQPRRAGDPAYLVQFAVCTAPCGNNRTVRSVSAPTGSSGWDWSTAAGTVVVGDFDGDGKADLYFQAPTAAGTSQIVKINAAGTGPVSTELTTPSEPALVEGGGTFTGTPGTAVGGTIGEFSVDPSGAAHYDIPIVVPPGVAGMAPDLTLAYSSGGGNSYLGPGWSLTGLSAIARCPKTFAQDGITGTGLADGVDLDSEDKWCLDGARLQALSGSSTEFRTHIESFQQVVASAAPGAATVTWTVKDKAGLTRTYGAYSGQSDGVVAAQGQSTVALTYLVKHIQDGFGNFIHFDYTQDAGTPGSYVPLRVKYGYSTSSAVAEVAFEYETRPDVQWGYLAGTQLSNNKRLTRVATSVGSRRVREYAVTYKYSPTSNRSVVQSVIECERRNNTCLKATTFDWQTGARGYIKHKYFPSIYRYRLQILDVDGNGINDYVMTNDQNHTWRTRFNEPNGVGGASTPSFESTGSHWLSGDFNGDGFGDIAQYRPETTNGGFPPVGNNDQAIETGLGGGPAANGGFQLPVNSVTTGLGSDSWDTAVVGDLNGDGRDDVAYMVLSSNELTVRLGTATGVAASPAGSIALSHAANPAGRTCTRTSEAMELDQATLRPIQFDSDGLTDIMLVRRTTFTGCSGSGGAVLPKFALQVYSFTGAGFELRYSYQTEQPNYSKWEYARPLDANGDGLTDVMFAETDAATGWTLYLSTGTTFTTPWSRYANHVSLPTCSDAPASNFGSVTSTYDSPSGCHHGSLGSVGINFDRDTLRFAVFLDYNQDGRTDILVDDDTNLGPNKTWKALVATPNSTGVPQFDQFAYDTGALRENYGRAFALDVGGDGIPEIVSQGETDQAWYVMHGRGPRADLVNQIDNGLLEKTVQIQYSSTTDTGAYLGFENDMDGDGDAGNGSGGAPVFPYAHATGGIPIVKKYLVPDAYGNYISTFYTYRGAKQHRQGYGFAGFAEVVAWNDNAATETSNRYLQSFPWTGMIAVAQARAPHASSFLLSQGGAASVLLKYWATCDGSGAAQDQTPIDSACWFMRPGTQAAQTPAQAPVQPPFRTRRTVNTYKQQAGTASVSVFPYLEFATETVYALPNSQSPPTTQPPVLRVTTTDFRTAAGLSSYDSYGNVGRILVTVTDGSGGNLHKTETQNWYGDNPALWYLGRLKSTRVDQTRKAYGDTVTSLTATRVSNFDYNSSTGLLTSETLEPATYGPNGTTSNPNGSSLWMTKAYAYDGRGNRQTETHSGATIAGYAVANRITTTDYNGSGDQLPFPSKTTNAETHQETYSWDARFGAKTALTGPNGLTTGWSYDGFGRQISEVAALSSVVTDTSYEWCGSGYSCAAGSKYKVITTSSTGARTVVEYDGMRREVFRTTTAATGSDLLQQRGYDPLGREFRVSLPYRSGQNPCWTLRRFDFQDRTVQEWSPGPSNALTSNCTLTTAPAYDSAAVLNPSGGHLKTMTYDEIDGSGNIKTTSNDATRIVVRLTNVMDRLLAVTEAPSAGNISTTYDYDANGNNTRIQDPDGNVTLISFNARGFKVSLSDPNMGVTSGAGQGGWRYVYNAYGELVEQTDARDIKICQSYDKLGRMLQRVDGCNYAVGHSSRFVAIWEYDTAQGKGVGQLRRATGPFLTNGAGVQQTNPYQEEYTYDELGRPVQVVRLIDGVYFWSNATFDSQGRIATQTYPASEETATASFAGGRRHLVKYEYNDRGALSAVKSGTGLAYWSLGSTDALGNVTGFTLGNGAQQSRAYDAATGFMFQNSANLSNVSFQFEEYDWSMRGNLVERRDNALISANTLKEHFDYDAYDRLITTKVTAPAINGGAETPYSNTYSNSGRLLTKGTSNGGGYTGYTYGTGNTYANTSDAGTHAVASVVANGSTRTFLYDNNGNMIYQGGSSVRQITWTAANLPEQIVGGAYSSTFSYGPDRARYRQFTTEPCSGCNCVPPTSTTLYVGDSFERIATNANTTKQYRHYIRAGSLTIAIHTEYSTGTGTVDNYLHHDHLGSVVAMTNSAGAVVERFSFDPWGKRRNVGAATAWSALSPGANLIPATLNIQTRGFTNHEHLDRLGLIHMNGRVYDPELGRFISADSMVQFPESTQGFDRYAYVNNNPLSYTDPSGHIIWLAAQLLVAKLLAGHVILQSLAAAAIGYLSTGTLQGALFGALTVGANWLAGPLGVGLVSGVQTNINGGRFGKGFLSGLTYAAGMRWANLSKGAGSVIKAAIVGGTANRIGGGKFGNGALTGAFAQLLGEGMDALSRTSPTEEYGLSDQGKAEEKQPPYGTEAPAELVALRAAHPELVKWEDQIWSKSLALGKEVALIVFVNVETGTLRPQMVLASDKNPNFIPMPRTIVPPKGYSLVLVEHTHPFPYRFGVVPGYMRGPSPGFDSGVMRENPGAFHVIQAVTPLQSVPRQWFYYGAKSGY